MKFDENRSRFHSPSIGAADRETVVAFKSQTSREMHLLRGPRLEQRAYLVGMDSWAFGHESREQPHGGQMDIRAEHGQSEIDCEE